VLIVANSSIILSRVWFWLQMLCQGHWFKLKGSLTGIRNLARPHSSRSRNAGYRAHAIIYSLKVPVYCFRLPSYAYFTVSGSHLGRATTVWRGTQLLLRGTLPPISKTGWLSESTNMDPHYCSENWQAPLSFCLNVNWLTQIIFLKQLWALFQAPPPTPIFFWKESEDFE
jgi:hypothetical protein